MSYVTELEIESPESWQDPEVYRFTDHPRYHDFFYPVVQRMKNEGGYGILGQPALSVIDDSPIVPLAHGGEADGGNA